MPSAPLPYHWTPTAQHRFIETLADTGSVAQASAAAGKSRHATYSLRQQSELFATGWDAAIRLARGRVEAELLAASMEPIVFRPVPNPETGRKGWRRADPALRSGMGLSLLQRLDRAAMAAKPAQRKKIEAAERDFEAFLDCVEKSPSRTEILDFLFIRNERGQVRIHCNLPQNSVDSSPPDQPALAHSSSGGHPHGEL